MFEKVNPSHPDKLADRIAGALVDIAYSQERSPRIAVEVLIGHGHCHVICETSTHLKKKEVAAVVHRIAGKLKVDYKEVPQDTHLANNQAGKFRCGDNGIFKGTPVTEEQKKLTRIVSTLYRSWKFDGKCVLDEKEGRLIICQSNIPGKCIREIYPEAEVNPIGDWSGGTEVDTGATNRKLGSDLGDGVTGGGIHGKDLSKADVSVNIYAFLKAQRTGRPVILSCAIGDEFIDGKPYGEIVCIARKFINEIGGFEALAEWGLIRC